MRVRGWAAGVAAALLVAGLTACASGPSGSGPSGSGPSDPAPSPSDGNVDVAPGDLAAAWLDGGRAVGIVTWGSSTCVPTAEGTYADGVFDVTLTDGPDDQICTADMAARVSYAALQPGVEPQEDLEIIVRADGAEPATIVLPGVPGLVSDGETDYLPSAGWTTDAGTFVVLLWGSSGCKEYVTGVEVTGDVSVTASLSGVPADAVCTADMAPNPVLAWVSGMEGVADVQLTLTSPAAEPVTIPIVGAN